MAAGRSRAGQRLTLDTPVLTTGPGQLWRGRPRRQALPARQPHSQHSGSLHRGPQSPPAPRCGTPARSGNSLSGRWCLRPSSGALHCPAAWPLCDRSAGLSVSFLSIPPSSTQGLTITHRAAGAREGPGRVRAQAGAFSLAALDVAFLVAGRVGRGRGHPSSARWQRQHVGPS